MRMLLKPRPNVVHTRTQTSHGPYEGSKLSEKIAIVPILRGGLGMVRPLHTHTHTHTHTIV
jgi:uracil phosphoribosyltransferase